MKMSAKTYEEKYWYARGYYDGRTIGVRDDLEELDGNKDAALRVAYKQGYDKGVADYSEMEV
jgi:hypothetical protein